MIKKLAEKISRAFAATGTAEPDQEARASAIRMATAVLMTEVARSDYEYDESEFNLLLDLVSRHFHISPEEAAELANRAHETAEDYVSLYSFTHLLNENLSALEKEHIVSLLWQIAYADQRLDKYEDSLVLKISDLLYVSRMRVMRLKHDANPRKGDS
jgi:uncharacterized tellurite resistance protein B-like protein